MAKVDVVVEFDLKEVQDALLEKARELSGIKAGGAKVEFTRSNDGIVGAVVRLQRDMKR